MHAIYIRETQKCMLVLIYGRICFNLTISRNDRITKVSNSSLYYISAVVYSAVKIPMCQNPNHSPPLTRCAIPCHTPSFESGCFNITRRADRTWGFYPVGPKYHIEKGMTWIGREKKNHPVCFHYCAQFLSYTVSSVFLCIFSDFLLSFSGHRAHSTDRLEQ